VAETHKCQVPEAEFFGKSLKGYLKPNVKGGKVDYPANIYESSVIFIGDLTMQ
jgi:hypothetical protein